nr:MAG TPA: hypothetical protein [Bacteriophage sp.]DAV37750.1 MAG TPA: hypothetical protein [Bacteriophage sp.]
MPCGHPRFPYELLAHQFPNWYLMCHSQYGAESSHKLLDIASRSYKRQQ